MVAGVILNGLNSGLQRLDCDFECDLPCLCNLYGFCFGFSQSDIVQFHILVNSVQVSGFKFFKNITIHIHRNRDVLVTEYFLQDLRRYAAFDAARGKGMPLRYNNDKQKKPLFSRGLSVCRLLFNSFSKLKIDENYKEKRRLFY